MPRLNLSNNFETTLANGITETDTSFDLTDATGAPATPFRGTIYEDDPKDGEIVEVGNISGNTLSNVQRGLEGTPAQAWVAGMKFAVLGTAGTYGELVSTDDSRLSGKADIVVQNIESSTPSIILKADFMQPDWASIVLDGTQENGIGYVYAPNNQSLSKFDATTNTWTALTGLTGSSITDIVALIGCDGYLYILGGSTSEIKCWKYDIAADSYAEITPIPYAGTGAVGIRSVAYDGIIYAGGGDVDGAGINSFYKYDPGTDSWTQLADIPWPYFEMDVNDDGIIFAVSGSTNGTDPGEIAKYDILTDTWTTLSATVGGSLRNPLVRTLNGFVYIATVNPANSYAEVYKYDPASDTATKLLNTNKNHVFGASMKCVTNDSNEPEKIYFVGGMSQGINILDNEEFNRNPVIVTAPLTGIVRWGDNTIEGVVKDSTHENPPAGEATFIGTTT